MKWTLLIFSALSFFTFYLLHHFFYKKAQVFHINKAYQKAVRWSSQSKPITGGITFFISFLFGTSFFLLTQTGQQQIYTEYLSISLALIIAFFTGLADDMLSISPELKLLLQAIAAFILVYSGLYIHLFSNDWLNYALTMVWYIGMMNSINMLDNMDSVATSMSIISLSGFLYLNLLHFQNFYDSFIMLSLFFALITFLFYNFYPSKMYMGDNGSLFLGLFLAIMAVKYLWNTPVYEAHSSIFSYALPFLCVLLFFLIPLTDTFTVTINRLKRKRSPFLGGKDHTTHALYYIGLSENKIVLLLSIFNLISVSLAIYLILTDFRNNVALVVSFFYCIFVVLFLYINATIYIKKNKTC